MYSKRQLHIFKGKQVQFDTETVGKYAFTSIDTLDDQKKMRKFFSQYYDDVAPDVFPTDDFAPFFNTLGIKVSDLAGNIVGGLLSCAPPVLAEEAFRTNTEGNAMKRIKRLTFLDLFSVANDDAELYSLLIDIYEQTSIANEIKSIIGFVDPFSQLASKLRAHNFVVLKPHEPAPSLQGISWELPPSMDKNNTVWFYKNLKK